MAQRGQDLLSRLADRGEEAIQRLADVPGANRFLDAATGLRERVDELQKRMRGLDEIERRVDELERRVDALSGTKTSARRRPAASKAAGAKRSGPGTGTKTQGAARAGKAVRKGGQKPG